MAVIDIPCVLMRGGTSRGPVFLASDLPADPALRDAVLVAAMGSGHGLQVDGVGGGDPLTSKVAIVGPSRRADADVDYQFAQVNVHDRTVDTSPNCGNMLAAVGPFAIEQGIVPATPGTTRMVIHNVNTGKLIEARVSTPNGAVTYEGDTRIDGVPGQAAPIGLAFLDAAGAKTGRLFPTSRRREMIGNVEVSCIDAAMPLCIMQAEAFGLTAHESPDTLNADRALLARLEHIRLEAGARMGLGDVSRLVIPKPVLVGPPRNGGDLCVRYFMPHACHGALAVTGAVGIATAVVTAGTILSGEAPERPTIAIEHPSGRLEVRTEQLEGHEAPVVSVVRTARRIFRGLISVALPDAIGGLNAADAAAA